MALRYKNLTFAVGNICNDSDQKSNSKAMQEAVVNKIKSKIAHCKFGEVFFVSSFPQYDVEYVTKLLAMFEKEGLISRISKGVYVKARKTRFGILYPSASELASEIAKRDKAVIIPTGVTAANLLGFSTQVPMTTSFLTTDSIRRSGSQRCGIIRRHRQPQTQILSCRVCGL